MHDGNGVCVWGGGGGRGAVDIPIYICIMNTEITIFFDLTLKIRILSIFHKNIMIFGDWLQNCDFSSIGKEKEWEFQ